MYSTKELILVLSEPKATRLGFSTDISEIADGVEQHERITKERADILAEIETEARRHREAFQSLTRRLDDIQGTCRHPLTRVHVGFQAPNFFECRVCGKEL